MQNNSIFSVSVGDLDFLEKCFIPLTTDKKLYCDLGRSSDIRPCDLSRERQTFLKLHIDEENMTDLKAHILKSPL